MQTSLNSPLWPGVLAALGAAVLFGLSAPASKALLIGGDPWVLAGVLYLGAGVWLLIVRLVTATAGTASPEAGLTRADLSLLALVVGLGGGSGPLLLMLGLARTSSATGALLLNLEAVATLAVAWAAFRENVDRRLVLGAGRSLRGLPSCLGAGAVNLMLGLWVGHGALPGPLLLLAGGVTGFLGIGVGLVLFMLGLRHLGAARTGGYFSLAPSIGAALAVLAFGAEITPALLMSGARMGGGQWLHLTEHYDRDNRHGALDHDHLRDHDDHHQHDHGPRRPADSPA